MVRLHVQLPMRGIDCSPANALSLVKREPCCSLRRVSSSDKHLSINRGFNMLAAVMTMMLPRGHRREAFSGNLRFGKPANR